MSIRNRKQNGTIVRIGDRWYVRYWERRSIGGSIQRKRVTYLLGEVSTRRKRPRADIKTEAERHMATVNAAQSQPSKSLRLAISSNGCTCLGHKTTNGPRRPRVTRTSGKTISSPCVSKSGSKTRGHITSKAG